MGQCAVLNRSKTTNICTRVQTEDFVSRRVECGVNVLHHYVQPYILQ